MAVAGQSSSMEKQEEQPLHIFVFPFMAHGHTIPMIDTAKLLASRGVRITLLTTKLNSPLFTKSTLNFPPSTIAVHAFDFQTAAAGLPDGCEDFDFISSRNSSFDVIANFFKATFMLQDQFEDLIAKTRPDCVISDAFFPWTTASAAKYGIPRLVFRGTSFFSSCVSEFITRYKPHDAVSSDSEPFLVPGLPDPVMVTRNQMPPPDKLTSETFLGKVLKQIADSGKESYGSVNNTFHELEPAYADLYNEILGEKKKVWSIGPVSLCNNEVKDRANRGGKESSIDEDSLLQWLDSKPPRSVVYVCFGSLANFSDSQLKEMAAGLEISEHRFIWVVRKGEKSGEKSDWLPEGFEERMEGKGLIIRGWAPQVLILEHKAVGGFITHCGWNSTMEGIAAGVPMVTWPVSAEQFYNETFVTDILCVGVGVGVKEWTMYGGGVEGGKVAAAVVKVMSESAAAVEMRRRVAELGKMARRSVEEGGSSFGNLGELIEEVKRCRIDNF
uniref:Glycosyltransferase n=1 Tax=Linum usitatissimum TaxID=4006 RepID=I2BH48_LINUS|nr:UDP-glycosyltransferase 1 [Linum usitatissimum]